MPFQGVRGGAVWTAFLAVEPQAHQPASAHHRYGGKLAFQPAAVEFTLVQHSDVEGVVRAGRHLAGQGVGALAHLTAVAAIDHRGADPRRGGLQKALDVGPLGEDHDPAEVPGLWIGAPAKNDASATRRRCAASEAARCWPFCWETTPA